MKRTNGIRRFILLTAIVLLAGSVMIAARPAATTGAAGSHRPAASGASFAVEPTTLEQTMVANTTATQTLTIRNTGTQTGTFRLYEFPSQTTQTLLNEGFEGATFPPTGWSIIPRNSDHSWERAGDDAHTGNYGARVIWDYDQDEWLLTPEFNLATASLTLWSRGSRTYCTDIAQRESWDYCDLNVWIVVGAVGGGDDIFVGKLDDDWQINNVWAQSTYNLTPLLPGGPVRIGFQYVGDDADTAAIDDITLTGVAGGDIPWLSENPLTNSVPAGSSAAVTVTFNSAGLATGDYQGKLRLVSSGNPPIDIPVTLHVIDNFPPVAVDDAYSMDMNTTLTVDAAGGVLANDTDANDAALTAHLVSDVSHGALTLNADGSFAYTPAADFYGTDSFTYKASDGKDDSNVATVTITVNFVNTPPVAEDDAYEIDMNTTLTVDAANGVLKNDSDHNHDPLTAQLVTNVAHGSLALNADGSFTYQPETDFHGTDSFTYQASDGTDTSNTATVTITVNFVNTPPVAANDSYKMNMNTTLTANAAGGVLKNDTDHDHDPLTAQLVTNVTHGSLTLNADGSFTYQPETDFYGMDTFTYRAHDGTDVSNTATVTINVKFVNTPPVAQDDAYSLDMNTTLTVDAAGGVLKNDSDHNGDKLKAQLVSDVGHGSLTLNADGSFVYTPEADYFGTDSFTYRAYDGADVSSAATVTLTVNFVNTPPVAEDDAYTVNMNATLTVGAAGGVLANDSDHDHDTLTAQLVANVAHGSLTLNADGSFVYTPAPGFHGTDTFTYQAFDGTDASNTAAVTIAIRQVAWSTFLPIMARGR